MDYNEKTAKKYDKILYPAFHRIRKNVVKIAKKLEVKSIADFCCGTGNQLKYLQKAGFKDILGVDLSENMMSQAKIGEFQPKCLLEDATQTSLLDSSYDMAMVSFALHEKPIEVAQAMILEAKRVVKDGGYFVAVDYYYDKKTFFIGKWATTYVEYLAGGDHYANFKTYISKGGLNFLMKDYKFIEEKPFLFGSVKMRIYQF